MPGIIGLGKACEIAEKNLDGDVNYLKGLRDELIDSVLEQNEEAYLNGRRTKRLPGNVNFRFTGIEGESLVLHLDLRGIAASTGSACSSTKLEPSHVLMAIGLEEIEAHGSLRLSLGRENTEEDVKYIIQSIKEVVANLRKMSPLWCNREE